MSDEKELKELPSHQSDVTLDEVREVLGMPTLGNEKGEEVVGKVWTEAVAAAPPKPPQMIMFDRYFMSLGRPMHHKAGMLAFVNTKGKKTREAWEALFSKY